MAGLNETGGIIENCYSLGNILAMHQAGGITGYNNGSIANCYATGDIETNYGVKSGGVSGGNSGIIKNCVAINQNIKNMNSLNYSTIGRITCDNTNILANNYARNTGMTIGILNLIPGHDLKDGEDVSVPFETSFWTTSTNWYNNTGWNFTNDWELGDNNIPILRNMPEGEQNPEY